MDEIQKELYRWFLLHHAKLQRQQDGSRYLVRLDGCKSAEYVAFYAGRWFDFFDRYGIFEEER